MGPLIKCKLREGLCEVVVAFIWLGLLENIMKELTKLLSPYCLFRKFGIKLSKKVKKACELGFYL